MTIDRSTTTATRFEQTPLETYAYRRFGAGAGLPLLCLQHFTGTLDNWDPAVVDALASEREVILFESAGIGRSTGAVPNSIPEMARHAFAFISALGVTRVDVLGFSLGGMVAQQMAIEQPKTVRKMVLAGTAPEGGEDIMHTEAPALKSIFDDFTGYERLARLFFTQTANGVAAGEAFVSRLQERRNDREPLASSQVAPAQIAAFRAWERYDGERFEKLSRIQQPCLVVSGVRDIMIPVRNSYMLAEHISKATLVVYPDAGHGSLFQYNRSFVTQARLFLNAELA
ncbi:MAG: alpha/beta hydrolase [Candidatus Eremiobacteraeota bacterium]|nr:alpha/beta hydrolase [Candidatus Eremiobacteraeota bacterium]